MKLKLFLHRVKVKVNVIERKHLNLLSKEWQKKYFWNLTGHSLVKKFR